jgi:MFS transporter, SHS family, lactate transporter
VRQISPSRWLVAYYSVNALFATHLQKDLHFAPALVATPIFFANLGLFLSTCGWGWWSDRFGRRWAIIIPALIALPLAPLYLLSENFLWIAVGFILQGMCAGGGMQGQMAPYLNERFPTEIRATASAFCYHQAALFGGLVPLVLTFLAERFGTRLAEPMIIGTWIGCLAWRRRSSGRDQGQGPGARSGRRPIGSPLGSYRAFHGIRRRQRSAPLRG